MALRIRVRTLMDEELTSRAAEKRAKAGTKWEKQPMGFFFPRNEDTVDLCALAVLKRALEGDSTRITQSVAKGVRELVSTSTAAEEAITIIFLATARPLRVR